MARHNTNLQPGERYSRARHPRFKSIECYDRLPKSLRDALKYSNHDWCPIGIYNKMKRGPKDNRWNADQVIAQIEKTDTERAYNWLK